MVSRPSGGLISDKFGSRKWTMIIITAGIGVSYLMAHFISSSWPIPLAIAVTIKGLAEPPDPDYPFVLTNGRLYGHWHTQTRTGRIEKICKMHPEPFIEIHPRDAAKLGIVDSMCVEVRSRRGKAKFSAKVTKAIAPGTVFVPMHCGSLWADNAEANVLTHPESCPDSLQPELKACAVQLILILVEVTIKNHQLKSSQSSAAKCT